MIYSKEIAQDLMEALIEYMKEEGDGELSIHQVLGEAGVYADLLHRFEQIVEPILMEEGVDFLADVSRKRIELPDPEGENLAFYQIIEQFPAAHGDYVIAQRIEGDAQFSVWIREDEIYFRDGIVFPKLEEAELYCLQKMQK